jgi:hypothetical protein
MKLALLSVLLFAASALAVAQVPIPYDNCGGASDHIKVSSATASVWPPVPGQQVTISLQGALNELLTGGSYIVQVSFDGFPIVNQQGFLKDLPNITWPIQAGPINIQKTVTVPTIVPAGSNVVVNVSALDQNGQSLVCFGIAVTVPSAQLELAKEDVEESVFNVVDAVAAGRVSIKNVVGMLMDAVSSEIEVDGDELVDPTPVPYTNCGQVTDVFTIESITSTVWPPALGQTAALAISMLVNAPVQDGTYSAVVSVDGFPLITKTGDISKYIAVPIAKGLVSINKNITLPSSLPISGTIGIQLSATDSTTQDELFCLAIQFSI